MVLSVSKITFEYLQPRGVVPMLMNTVVCTVVVCDTKSHSSTRCILSY